MSFLENILLFTYWNFVYILKLKYKYKFAKKTHKTDWNLYREIKDIHIHADSS